MTYADNIIDIDHLLMIKNGYDVPVYVNGVYQSRMDIFVNTVTRVICLYVSDVSVVCVWEEGKCHATWYASTTILR